MLSVILLFLFPVAGAVLTMMVPKKRVTLTAIGSVTGMLVSLIWLFLQKPPGVWRVLMMPWKWMSGAAAQGVFGVLIDPLSTLLLLIVVVLGFLVILYGAGYISARNREHAGAEGRERHNFWLLLFIAAMIGVALSPNLLQLFFFWELTTLCSWALISHYRNDESLRAGFKALLMTFSGGLFFAAALVVLYVFTGRFDFDAISELAPRLRFWVFLFFLIAAWAKSAQFPFYTWLPDAMAAPTTVSMYLHAAAMVKAGVFLIARLTLANYAIPWLSGVIVAVLAVVTMLIALFLFFTQNDLKKLLAYSTIAHLAYVFFGLGIAVMGSKLGAYAGAMHILNHSVAKGLLFLSVGVLSYAAGTRQIDELSGVAKKMPLLAIAFICGMFALLGVPPFSGFWSKFYLLAATIKLGGAAGWLLLIPFLLEIVLGFAWFLHIGHKVFFGAPSQRTLDAQTVPWSMQFALVVLIILTLVVPYAGLHLMQAMGM